MATIDARRNRKAVMAVGAIAIPVFVAGTLSAEQPASKSGAVTEKASVTIVEVPVSVIGRDGKPIAGLKASDFELFEDGKRREITGFDAIDLSLPVRSAAKPETTDTPATNVFAQTRWMIVFDLSYTSLSGLLRARDAAKKLVGTFSDRDLVSVSTVSAESGWKLLVNFTTDRDQVSRAIETLGMTGLAVRAQDPLDFAFLAPGPLSSGRGLAASPISDEDQLRKELQTMRQSNSNERAQGRVTQFVTTLARMAHALQSVRGRKHVLFFSEGFESRLLAGNAGRDGAPYQQASPSPNMDTTGEASVNGELWRIDSDTRFGGSSTRQVLHEALSQFRSTDTVVHALDISGLRAEGDMTKLAGASGSEALFEMANGTGGDLVRNANALTDQLQAVVEHARHFYVLAFQASGPAKPGTFHPLKVKVKADGAKVLARSGYYEGTRTERLSPIERVLASGDLITGGMRDDLLHVHMLAAPFPVDLGLAQVPVIIEIPFGASSHFAGGQTPFQIYAYAANAQGTLTDYLSQEMTVDVPKVRETGASQGIKYYGTLLLPPGDYELRVLVHCVTTDESSVRVTSLHVPVVPGGPAVVLTPFFEAAASGWTMVKGAARSESAVQKAGYPFSIASSAFVPAAAAMILHGSDARVALMTYNFSQGTQPAPLQVHSEVVDRSGRARPIEHTLVERSDGERWGGRKLVLALRPQGFAPGAYRLKVTVSDPVSPATAEATSSFEIR